MYAQHASTYPTLTQVPPSLLFSMIMAFTPYIPLARLAHASPPLPPPTTRRSVSFVVGAIFACGDEKCRDSDATRAAAVLDGLAIRNREARRRDSLSVVWISGIDQEGLGYRRRGTKHISVRLWSSPKMTIPCDAITEQTASHFESGELKYFASTTLLSKCPCLCTSRGILATLDHQLVRQFDSTDVSTLYPILV